MLLSAGNTKLVDRRENYPIYMPHNINIYVKDENSQHPSRGGLQKNISFRAFGSAQLQLRVASKKKNSSHINSSNRGCRSWILLNQIFSPSGLLIYAFQMDREVRGPPHRQTCLRHAFRGRKKNLSL